MAKSTLHADFIENLRREMARQGINQTELAEKMEVSSAYVSQVLLAKNVPSLTVVENFAKALGVDRLQLLDIPGPKK